MWKSLLFPPPPTGHTAIALLAWRVFFGAAFMMHGYGKIQNPFHWMGENAEVPALFQGLAAFSEFFGGLAIALGLLTPLAAAGIAATMTVAALKHIRHGDPFVAHGGPGYEPALGYLVQAFVFLTLGPGELSLDALLRKKLNVNETL